MILVFLWHIPSAIVPIVTIPVSVLLAFIPLYFMGLTSNIMSLAGIAISIGVLVDGAIVEVENAYKRLEQWIAGGRQGDFHAVRLQALKEVGPSVFFSLLVIAVAFLPIFTLVDQEGRLFKPLAYTKNLAMAIAALLADHARPGAAHAVHAHGAVHVPAALARPRLANAVAVGTLLPRGAPPDQPRALRASTSRSAAWCCAIARRRSSLALLLVALDGAGLPARSARSSCRRSTRAPSSTCRRRCPACRSPRRSACSRSRTGSCASFPRSSASSARPGAPTRPPTRRRSRWSRRRSC